MIVEREISLQQMLDWVQSEFAARGVTAIVYREQTEERQEDVYTFVRVPVRLADALEAYDEARMFADIESQWNFQEPIPQKMLALRHSSVPQGVW